MEKLRTELSTMLGIQMTRQQETALRFYEAELIEWNSRFNLTAIADSEGIRSKHFLDSLTCFAAFREKKPKSLIDIGTGAGFPGLPLKIFLPDLKLTLVESVGKKTRFLEHIVKSLDLKQVEILQERAEALGQMDIYREKYDCAVARAVAIMPTLAEYLLPFVRVGGVAIAQKGESAPAEAHSADKAIYLLGGRFRQLLPVALPGVADERYLVVIDKVAATPSRYPRRVGVPSKSPLQAAPPTKDD